MPSCWCSTVVVIIVAVVTVVVIFCFRSSLFLALLANFCVVLVVCRASAQNQNVNIKLFEYVLFCIFIFFVCMLNNFIRVWRGKALLHFDIE